jgi:hypothetical protein
MGKKSREKWERKLAFAKAQSLTPVSKSKLVTWLPWIPTFALNGAGMAVSNGPWEVCGAMFLLSIPCTIISAVVVFKASNLIGRIVAMGLAMLAVGFTFWIADRVMKFPVDLGDQAIQHFIDDLKVVQQKPDFVLLSCPPVKVDACTFAEQFIPLFQRAGWKVDGPSVKRETPGRYGEMIILADYGPPLIHPQNPDEGVWTRVMPWKMTEEAAFKKLGIPVLSISDPALPETNTRVYFGSAPTRTLAEVIRSMFS